VVKTYSGSSYIFSGGQDHPNPMIYAAESSGQSLTGVLRQSRSNG